MERKKKKKQTSQRNPNTGTSSQQRTKMDFGASGLQIGQNEASHLVGRIVEKGISDEPPTKPYFPPNPTVLPFPVARHRSHGPHWAPVGSKTSAGYGDDHDDDDRHGGLGDEEDRDFMDVDPIAPFANPVERRKKKGMDFSNWRELVAGEKKSAISSGSAKTEKRERDRESIETVRESEDNKASSVAQMEIDYSSKDHGDASLMEMLKKRETNYSASTVVSSGSDFGNKQAPVSLESEIDAENRARLQGMSAEEIAEAQAEINQKMDPALLRLLKKRGQEKLKKQKSPSQNVVTNAEGDKRRNESEKDVKGVSVSEGELTHTDTQMTSKETKSGLDSGEARNPNPASGSLWSAWSERVQGVRELRFSLDGTVVENDLVQAAETERVAERDFLRTEGDPGAAGYTIKEAVALTRSVIPGQRALALHLLLAVLDKAIHNICQGRVGCSIGKDNKVDRLTDWEAIWAYALGPEPELALSLRLCLDDNHNSVVLACAKVIQCILTCDVNESFFNFSEKITTIKDICTAPVFRSKPEIDVGFLRGAFWKYNAKPSNVLTLNDDIIDDETEEKHTIQDDVVVAGQDFAAGLVRMGILLRLRYLFESDPTAALEECLISILIAIARHSPTCANAIMKCQRLIETVVDRFTPKDNIGIHPSKIKSVVLLKVLARADKKNCLEFIKNGVFHIMTWRLCQNTSSIDHWVESGQESCKLSSALMVEQLRFWRVCIQHGYSVSCFSDIFPSLCLWLNPPTLEKLIENGVLCEFASISAETFLVLKALATRLPSLFSQMHLGNQIQEQVGNDMEIWSWSHVSPMVDLAVKWILVMGDLHARNFSESGIKSDSVLQDSCVTSLLWVYSAVMGMLAEVLKRITPDDAINQMESGGHIPWLPEFVPKVGLEIIKNGFLIFSDTIGTKFGTGFVGVGSFVEKLCYLRQQNEPEVSLASVCCLCGFIQTISSIDILIRLAKKEVQNSQEYSLSREEKILKDGILKGSLVELRSVQSIFMKLVASEWQFVQSIETFGRGGPAPGVGVGWGASGGGFWSVTVLLAQADARLTADLLEILSIKDVPRDEEMASAVQIINSALASSLVAGPRERNIVDRSFRLLVHVSVLKYFDLCIRHFLCHSGRIKLFGWEYKEEDYLLFSKILTSHFSNRWFSVKKKLKPADKTFKKGNGYLDTIHEDEDLDTKDTVQDGTALVVEWAHQRLPLPVNWFLSPISTLCDSKNAGLRKCPNLESLMQDPGDLLEVAKGGLFFLLGIEAMSSFLPSDVPSPVQSVPLVWKLHALSVILLVGMAVIEDDKNKDVYEALQDLYGDVLDKARHGSGEITSGRNVNLSLEPRNQNNLEFLRFQSDIHDSYSTFIETLVEQFSAVSYGDLIYGRQVAIYLHRCVEAPVRLAAWKALTNARVLELLPPLGSCIGEAEGYLQPLEDDADVLEAYVKSWTSGALDRAATRGSIAYALVLHHLSHFIFHSGSGDKLLQRNKLARSLLRDFSLKQNHEAMMLNLIHYDIKASSQTADLPLDSSINKKFEVLTEACERNSSLLNEVKKLKSLVESSVL